MPSHPERHLTGRPSFPAVLFSGTTDFGCACRRCAGDTRLQLAFEYRASREPLDLFGTDLRDLAEVGLDRRCCLPWRGWTRTSSRRLCRCGPSNLDRCRCVRFPRSLHPRWCVIDRCRRWRSSGLERQFLRRDAVEGLACGFLYLAQRFVNLTVFATELSELRPTTSTTTTKTRPRQKLLEFAGATDQSNGFPPERLAGVTAKFGGNLVQTLVGNASRP